MENYIKHTTRDGERYDGYLAIPKDGRKYPAILIISAIFGVDREMEILSDQWADDGFIVSAPDIFWRQMPGPTTDMAAAFDRMNRFDVEQGLRDIEDLIKDLRTHPRCNGKVAVLGFCFGGRYAHLATARFGANAAGAFHGTGIDQHLDEVGAVKVPVSYHFGDNDPVIPLETVRDIQRAFASKPSAEIVVHQDSTHNFSMPQKDGYNPVAAKASRDAVLRCFRSM